MKRSVVLAAIVSVTFGAAGIAATHRATDPIVVQRQVSMKEMATVAKTISEMFAGRLAYDARSFKAAAETIRRRSGDTLIAEFPTIRWGTPRQRNSKFSSPARNSQRLPAISRRSRPLCQQMPTTRQKASPMP